MSASMMVLYVELSVVNTKIEVFSEKVVEI